uniref:Nitric oxide synthase-interacting protein zinc-finger domain-containing protein n=1 Tax=Arcella intermedia TaxID=1963864 RepID=A0A6B2LDB6_9EUKA
MNRDSMKSFDACTLCLQSAINPMADLDGAIYCKQCIYQYLLDQKNLYKKMMKEYKKYKEEEKLEEQEKEKQLEATRIVAFVEREKGAIPDSSAKKQKEQINNFWLPASTPAHVKSKLKKPSSVILSPKGTPIKLKDLITLNLTPLPTLDSAKEKKSTILTKDKYMCPTCNKSLSNVSGVYCIVSTGNVFCQHCMDTVIKKDLMDPLTNTKFTEKQLLKLEAEGSSFACRSGNTLEATKVTPAPRL